MARSTEVQYHLRLSIETLENAESQMNHPTLVYEAVQKQLSKAVSGGVSEILSKMRKIETRTSPMDYTNYKLVKTGP